MFPPQQPKNTHVQLVDGFAPTHPREFRNKHAKKYILFHKTRSWKAKMDGFAAHLFNASYFFPLSNPSFTLSVCLPFTSSRVSLKSPCDDWNLVHHEVRTSENGGWFFLLDCSSRAINFPWTIDLGVGIIKRKIVGFWDDPSIFTHISVTTPTSKRGHIFFWDRIMYIPWKSNMYTENDGLEKRYVLFNFQGCLYVQICIHITYKKTLSLYMISWWYIISIPFPT